MTIDRDAIRESVAAFAPMVEMNALAAVDGVMNLSGLTMALTLINFGIDLISNPHLREDA